MSADPVKEFALSLANQALGGNSKPSEVVERAATYERYLRGEAASSETPQPIPDGGSVEDLDALHG